MHDYLMNYCNEVCRACPFNSTEESEIAYNLGCLPDISEIMSIKKATNYNWECHNGTSKVCGGFVAVCKDQNIDYKNSPLLDTTYYLNSGNIREKILQ